MAAVLTVVAAAVGTAGCGRFHRQPDPGPAPSTASGGPAAGTYERALTVGNGQRTYRMHVPESVAGRTGLPVVLALHGGGGNGAQFEEQSQLDVVADRAGFVVVYPNGSGRTQLLTWNAGNCCAYARDEGIDDVKFIATLLDALTAQIHTDPKRVYATGFSNGAMMSYRLGCELADRITAIAPVSGAIAVQTCEPKRQLPVLILHGTADANVPYNGGPPTKDMPLAGTWINKPVSYAVSFWTAVDKCPATPVQTRDDAVLRSTYAPCAQGTEVTLYTIEGGGHAWPGAQKARDAADDPAPKPDASAVIWDFFSRFTAP